MKDELLHLLINEEIYIVKSRQSIVDRGEPSVSEKAKIAFIHGSTQPEELALLDKIIDACKFETYEFKIVSTEQEISFEKAIIFSNEADQFYTPLKREQGEIMYSQPLQTLSQSKDEKAKLWEALQGFLG